jgi:branched-chain amino acid transport system permease protein
VRHPIHDEGTVGMIPLEQVMNMVSDGATLFLLAAGLAVVFGLMNIINFAHGALIMVGAYGASAAADQSASPWLAIPLGVVFGVVVGLLVETLVIRWLHDRPWDSILATIGIGLVLVAAVSIVFGLENKSVGSPLSGHLDLGFVSYSKYRLFLIAVSAALFVALWAITHRTRLGLTARAVIENESLASTHGINSRRVRRWTFVTGAALAGLAGSLMAPLAAVNPNMGDDYLVSSFMVVLVASGSVGALFGTSLLFGGLASLVSYITSPIIGSVTIIILTAAILRLRPEGLNALAPLGRLRRGPATISFTEEA